MEFNPHDYQRTAIQWVIEKPKCALFLDMGLGKSVITLTAISELIDGCEIDTALIVAPKKVAEATWSAEVEKWKHLRGLRVSKVIGTEKQRKQALHAKADIYVIGRDSFVWLCNYYQGVLPFGMIVIDELTSFKSPKSGRFKAMRIATQSVSRIVGLTGTPAPNGLIDLWAQMYCIDQGQRLGKSVTRYREAYFTTRMWNNIITRCEAKKGAREAIQAKIQDIALTMQARDYLRLPTLLVHEVNIPLPTAVQKRYNEFERDMVIEFNESHQSDTTAVLANSAAGLMNKLSQYANGAVYDEEGHAHEVHSEKVDKLCEIVEAANGSSGVLVFYQYKHDIPRITESLTAKGYKVATYHGAQQLSAWNDRKIDVLLAHPASTAFGLNMQQGGHYIVWFGTGWNLELYQQANARLYRQGQTRPVTVYKLVCSETIDQRASKAIESKRGVQQSLLDGLSYLLRKYDL